MKPFTLEWWIRMLQEAQFKKHNLFSDVNTNNFYAYRYLRLEYWIRNRIINKYGEQDA